MPRWGKPVSGHDAFFGFISGILVFGAVFMWLLTDVIWAVPLAVFAVGVISIMDTVFPFGRQTFMTTWVGGLITGFIAVVITDAWGFLYWLVAAACFAFVAEILVKVFGKPAKRHIPDSVQYVFL